MGRYIFKLPDVGEGTVEAEIVAWHVKVGDKIEEDQNLVDVMTDKATVEMTSPVTGVVVSLHGAPGEMATVGAPLVELDVKGAGNADASAPAAPSAKPKTEPVKPFPKPEAKIAKQGKVEEHKKSADTDVVPLAAVGSGSASAQKAGMPAFATRVPGAKPLASPAVRRRAEELGIPLQFVPGSGPAGRLEHSDLDAYVASGGKTAAAPGGYTKRDGVDEIQVAGLRRKNGDKE